jgi:hypothetical protein
LVGGNVAATLIPEIGITPVSIKPILMAEDVALRAVLRHSRVWDPVRTKRRVSYAAQIPAIWP